MEPERDFSVSLGRRRLYSLWHEPGQEMASGWWGTLRLSKWQEPYARHPLIRPTLNEMIARRLGQTRPVPKMSPLVEEMLTSRIRRECLCAALGLISLQCPDYLVLRRFRTALSPTLDSRALDQLIALMPLDSIYQARVAPEDLLRTALRSGVAWLSSSADPALVVCRLLWDPAGGTMSTFAAPEAVLEKLLRWL
ncbi:hypothetical protein IAG25_39100 [Caballeronia sp. EK]|uniref:type III secretion system domain-containing protein n=1 Tax=Caballeronia sp. EK TaxID=2767469 RepID=UPI0016564380|nr:hypothetical protein [Caballeronia sp. EK]